MYMFGVVGETHVHDYFEIISFYNSKRRTYITFSDMSLTINYVICVICNQRIICYLLFFISVILSVLSNKTNLILGYSSPLSPVHRASLRLYAWEASYILCLYGKLLLYSVTGVIVPIFLMKVRTIMDL